MEGLIRYLNNNNFRILYRTIDKQVSINLNSARVETRPSKSNGLWCCILLPIILNVYTLQYTVSPLYKFLAILSIGVLTYSILYIVFLSTSSMVLHEFAYGGCVASSLLAALLMDTTLGYGLYFSLLFSLTSIFMYSLLLHIFLTKCPNTFTVGEAMVLAQSIVLFNVMAIAKYSSNLDNSDEEMNFIYAIVNIVLITVAFIITALNLLPVKQRNLTSLAYIIGSAAIFTLALLHIVYGVNVLLRLFNFVFMENNRAKIFLFWFILAMISVVVITNHTKLAVKASTVTRKSFHISASLVFMSGILLDVNLMILAGGIVFGLLLVVEALRKSGIDPISSALQSAFDVYSDEKDCGCFAVTPLYLYLGLGCPLVLVPRHPGYELELLSGVLSIGVGDTAASWFGSKYGVNKWSGGNRTHEGTFFNILSQVATVYALVLFDFLNANNALLRTSIAATITASVEAKTNQIDNLVLPYVTILSYQLTWFLCN